MTKQEVDEVIESIHPDGTPMYEKYLSTIMVQTHGTREQATELFHHIYMNYVDILHNDCYKYYNHQLVVFDTYVSSYCQEFIWQKYKKERELERKEKGHDV